MKKLKIIKCLAPLLGLSITLGSVTPIIASCSENSNNNESNNGSNDNNQDSNQPGNGGDTSGPGNDNSGGNGDSGNGGGSDNGSNNPSNPDLGGGGSNDGSDSGGSGSDNPSNPDGGNGSGGDSGSNGDSGSTTPPVTTIPAHKEQWLKDKQVENQNILNNLVWLYDYRDPNNLDQLISKVLKIKNSNFNLTSPNIGKELGFYPHIKVGPNQFMPVTEWFIPVVSNNALKDKVFKLDYFIPEITPAKIESPSKNTSYVDTYKLSINKLTLSDATSEFPSGDPRTTATLEYKQVKQTNDLKTPDPFTLINIARPNPQSIKNLLTKYQKVITSGADDIQKIKNDLGRIATLLNLKGSQPFKSIFDHFNKFHKINASNVIELENVLNTNHAPTFKIIEDVARGLFLKEGTTENDKLLNVIKSIYDLIKSIKKEHENLVPSIPEGTPGTATNKQVMEVVDYIGVVLLATIEYYLSFVYDLIDLAITCVPNIDINLNDIF